MASLSTDAGDINPNSFWRGQSIHYGQFKVIWPGHSDYAHQTKTYDTSLDVFRGRVIKDFHRKKNSGQLLPYTYYEKIQSSSSGSGTWSHTYGGYQYFSGPGPYYHLGQPIAQPPEAQLHVYATNHNIDYRSLVQKAAADLYMKGWDGLTFAAEFAKVVAMFKGLVPKFINMIRAKGDPDFFKDIKRNWNRPLNHWLEVRYGWRTLVYDMQDIQSLIENLDEVTRTRSRKSSSLVYDLSSSRQLTRTGSVGTYTCTETDTITLSARGSIISDFTPSRIIFNPLTTGWELITLSFVVDWIYNIGQALEAFSFLVFEDNYTAAYGLEFDYRRVHSNASVVPNPPYTGVIYTQSVETKIHHLLRVPTTVPLLPYLNVRLSPAKIVDLLALLGQLIKQILVERGRRL